MVWIIPCFGRNYNLWWLRCLLVLVCYLWYRPARDKSKNIRFKLIRIEQLYKQSCSRHRIFWKGFGAWGLFDAVFAFSTFITSQSVLPQDSKAFPQTIQLIDWICHLPGNLIFGVNYFDPYSTIYQALYLDICHFPYSF